mmetsp:Transcript_38534/g.44910  ORF Transcript_38534/g.44910 Transcript_38534/m.44910 type:complete len:224 (-) Transcript_38534:178-849(-)
MTSKANPIGKPCASLEDFSNFHGMLCSPTTAKRCVDSFTGTVLFMPFYYKCNEKSFPNPFKSGGKKRVSHYEQSNVDPVLYYILVLISLTGLSTLLGLTDFIDVRETSKDEDLVSKHDARLKVDPYILQYISRRVAYGGDNAEDESKVELPPLKLIRRFEYKFHIPQIEVVMLHFTSPAPNGGELLHLVEVYKAPELLNQISRFLNKVIVWFAKFSSSPSKKE